MKPEDYTPDIGKLIADVTSAKEDFEAAKEEANIANGHEMACLNSLNHAQKALDKALGELRESMPKESDWRRE